MHEQLTKYVHILKLEKICKDKNRDTNLEI